MENKMPEAVTEVAKAAAPPGNDIYIHINLTNIRRDPKCSNTAAFEVKLAFFEKIRPLCKELIAENEHSNARAIYARAINCFKNMSKKECNELTEDQQQVRKEVLNILLLNSALCLLKKKMYPQCIKAANDALIYVPESPKAYYRIALAYKELNESDDAKENFEKAIKLAPGDRGLREEFEKFIKIKKDKEQKQWKAMAGFYNTNKMENIEKKELEETTLRDKVKRQHFHQEGWN